MVNIRDWTVDKEKGEMREVFFVVVQEDHGYHSIFAYHVNQSLKRLVGYKEERKRNNPREE